MQLLLGCLQAVHMQKGTPPAAAVSSRLEVLLLQLLLLFLSLTASQVLLVLHALLVVELCRFAVVHPYAAQLAPVHGVGLPSLYEGQAMQHTCSSW